MPQSDTDHSPNGLKPSALAGLTDEVLVARARGKDVAAFEELLGRYENKLYRLAMRFVQFGSWMYRVTVNAALMFLRARNRHPEVMLDDVEPAVLRGASEESVHGSSEDWSQRPDEQLQSEELRRHIQAAVDALPDGLRTVFLVRDVEGLSTEETAELLDLSLPAVKTRLHRARLALREVIGRYFAR